ncbi:MAG: hypothetical protein V5A38_05525 [Halolamina sp.]|uniref:hypothetical protein n=1 Tax=Halolamina sp. TaxID=1940283 RepID=UPI002FC27BF1
MWLAILLVGAGVYGTTVLGAPASNQPDPQPDQLVAPAGADSYIWPYTSRSRSTADRTLALNVVVHGEPEQVHRIFVDRKDANWTAADPNVTADISPWRPAHGSVRYTYLTTAKNETGRWVPAEYQLAVGNYFGQQTHIRAYPSASRNWTALQAHTEYWDWFRVRHTVTGVAPATQFVEEDLRDEPFVAEVSRIQHGHTGGGSAGWWTVVKLGPALLLAAGAGPLTSRQLSVRDAAIVVGLLGLVLGVRAFGLAAEAVFPGVNPKLFVAVGYPVLAVGPPLLVSALATDRPALRVSVLAAVGLLTATGLDLTFVGVVHVPDRIVFHRMTVAAALGIVAFGTARDDRHIVGGGLSAWVIALAAPLAGVL